jgi:glutamine synthetase adenylyltransferase
VLQAKHQLWFVGNLSERLRRLREHGLIEESSCQQLIANARFLRTVEHVVRLVSGRTRKWLPIAEHPRRAAQKLLWRAIEGGEGFDPEIRLREVMSQTREIYLRCLPE